MTLAAVVAIWMTTAINRPHFLSLHSQLGLAVTVLGLLQPVNAYFRPTPQPRTSDRIVRTQHLSTGR